MLMKYSVGKFILRKYSTEKISRPSWKGEWNEDKTLDLINNRKSDSKIDITSEFQK